MAKTADFEMAIDTYRNDRFFKGSFRIIPAAGTVVDHSAALGPEPAQTNSNWAERTLPAR